MSDELGDDEMKGCVASDVAVDTRPNLKLILVAPWEDMGIILNGGLKAKWNKWLDEHKSLLSSYALLCLFWPEQGAPSWHPTSAKEVKKFFGVLLFMSQVRLPCAYTGYWNHKLYAQKAIQTSGMNKFRFYQLKKYLHLDNYTKFSAAQMEDKAFKLQREFQRFTSRVNNVWVSEVHINVDEGMVKGEQHKHPCKKRSPKKPIQCRTEIKMAVDQHGICVFAEVSATNTGEKPKNDKDKTKQQGVNTTLMQNIIDAVSLPCRYILIIYVFLYICHGFGHKQHKV
ncbi:hypothetical protein Pelo_17365 [Pelomyxa schiedti]|nr:hypothetical protein Pelo_17365 [Pelomyxa schiedti]